MSKVRRPLLSDGATGKMDEETVFSSRHGKSYRKRYAKPKQPNSESQKESKKTFAWAIKTWQKDLTDENREAWRAFARKNKPERTKMWTRSPSPRSSPRLIPCSSATRPKPRGPDTRPRKDLHKAPDLSLSVSRSPRKGKGSRYVGNPSPYPLPQGER